MLPFDRTVRPDPKEKSTDGKKRGRKKALTGVPCIAGAKAERKRPIRTPPTGLRLVEGVLIGLRIQGPNAAEPSPPVSY
jgi:hypothetical protein